eukprot:CAMPEP_0176378916 /NCGR_PEP_ID=MMETSP0126-20121128/29969_1 /TAXON_ID=141414 ORGANISM="Strombidinopsis acuminatum, Strain SPMC142" /NCGR_SAMPLE_ID=MMETSP0126 /ASSEMBLY_ACC=CAM_ASM_000229 /LENGTH=102 /DNA_ID=CAMNT_0017741437 /DNA_START=66 /DNA_END=374 /DNA_ORIENTATION=-
MLRAALVIAAVKAMEMVTPDTTADPEEFTCFDYTTGGTSLKVKTYTVFNEDEGKFYWRVLFNYTGLVQEDDIVYFYLSFTPTNLLSSRDVREIAEDIGYCKM